MYYIKYINTENQDILITILIYFLLDFSRNIGLIVWKSFYKNLKLVKNK